MNEKIDASAYTCLSLLFVNNSVSFGSRRLAGSFEGLAGKKNAHVRYTNIIQKEKKMNFVKISIVLLLAVVFTGCSTLNIYKNAYEPPDRKGKETWALVSVEKGPIGSILISPRPKDNAFKALASAGNHLARSRILLEPGVRDINVYAFNGNQAAVFVMSNVTVKQSETYVVHYKVNGSRINAWVENENG